ncbi:E3 ubiquitin-protein ligase RNF138 [Phyllobates terribilis]|uniref:E3 ubiquitin-protein ligase RNF138 n=1 Tax=Phyllobates terribilis TaxID=111132 RepID=UPI003CCAFCF5
MAEAKPSTSVVSGSSQLEDFRCSVCQEIFQTPVRTHNCRHVFCRKCLLMAFKAGGAHCPLCRGALSQWEGTTPTRATDLEAKMKTLYHACVFCGRQVKLSYMRIHYKSCKSYQEEFGTAPRVSHLFASDQSTSVINRLDSIYKCPLCPQGNLNRKTLLDHCNVMHYFEVAQAVCPICSMLPGGDANFASRNIVGHLNARHQFNYEDFMNVRDDEEAQLQAAIEKSSQYFY